MLLSLNLLIVMGGIFLKPPSKRSYVCEEGGDEGCGNDVAAEEEDLADVGFVRASIVIRLKLKN